MLFLAVNLNSTEHASSISDQLSGPAVDKSTIVAIVFGLVGATAALLGLIISWLQLRLSASTPPRHCRSQSV